MIHLGPIEIVVTFRIGRTPRIFTKQQVEITRMDLIGIVMELPVKVSLEHPKQNYYVSSDYSGSRAIWTDISAEILDLSFIKISIFILAQAATS